jgi:two-component system OmpR family response regulator
MPFATISSSSAAPPISDPAARELRILLVEDSVPLQVRLVELLTHAGVMQVTGIADTESAALELIESQCFDVMVVDVELRQGSGITVVRKTRARQGQPPFPLIIILTNYGLNSVRDRCLAAGADHFLDKMLEFNRLYPLISAAKS